eukprot:941493-Prymnesium_polylepis.1
MSFTSDAGQLERCKRAVPAVRSLVYEMCGSKCERMECADVRLHLACDVVRQRRPNAGCAKCASRF